MFNSFYRQKRILITGHTGFKGTWLSLLLLRLGARVIGFALDPPSIPSNFEVCNLESAITHIYGDVRNLEQLHGVFKKYEPEFVFHLAAQPLVRLSYAEPRMTYETNVMGTVNVFEAVRQARSVRVVLNITSDKCYENREWVWGYRENEPLGGYDPYSNSKACSELVTSAYRNSFFNHQDYSRHGVALASARAGNVIGGGDWGTDRLIPDCIRSILKNEPVKIRNPMAIRPWQHVLEPLCGYLMLGQKLYQEGPRFAQAWNFGPYDFDAKPVEWVVQRICALWGENASYAIDQGAHPHEAGYLKLNCAKARAELDWQPRWNLDSALEKIVEWTRAYQKGKDVREVCLKQIDEYLQAVRSG
ncbi:MAG: CDP-glucose 4,6-dehydratase [Desulfobacterales bacterium S5133MH16]|nr:MAG: CDP-glucose 4,6-dehydratase [Desulfobacterales bacterium S5133MH16]